MAPRHIPFLEIHAVDGFDIIHKAVVARAANGRINKYGFYVFDRTAIKLRSILLYESADFLKMARR